MKYYNGSEWKSEDLASPTEDGLMPKEDKATLDSASEFGKDFLTITSQAAARTAIGFSSGSLAELETGTSTVSNRVWSPKTITDYVKAEDTANLNEAKSYADTAISNSKTVVNVKDFGAVGDGITNDTASIQSAIDYIENNKNGGTVWFPPTSGSYVLSTKLMIKKGNITLYADPGTVFIRKGSNFGFCNMDRENNEWVTRYTNENDLYSGPSNITIDGGTWDGDLVNLGSNPTQGFNIGYFIGCQNIVVKNATFIDVMSNHALDINGVSGFLVENCFFLGYKDTTSAQDRGYAECIQISSNNEDTTGNLAYRGSPSTKITIRDCYFGNSQTPGSNSIACAVGNHSASIPAEGMLAPNNITVDNCTIENATTAGVNIYTWESVRVINSKFNGCAVGVLAGNATNGTQWNRTTQQWDTNKPTRYENTQNIECSGNTFRETAVAINLRGTNAGANNTPTTSIKNIAISGNTFIREPLNTDSTVRVAIADDVIITDNTIKGGGIGIIVQSVKGVSVRGNIIKDIQSTSSAIQVNSNTASNYNTENVIVTNNLIQRAGLHGIDINNTVSNLIFQGNSIIGWGQTNSGAAAMSMLGNLTNVLFDGNVITTKTGTVGTVAYRIDATTFSETYISKNNIIQSSTKFNKTLPTGVVYGSPNYL